MLRLALWAHLGRKHVVYDICVWTRSPSDLSMQSAWIISLRAFLAGCFLVAQCECTTHSCITQRRGVSDRWRGRQNLSAGALCYEFHQWRWRLKPTQLQAVFLLKNVSHIQNIPLHAIETACAMHQSDFYSAEVSLKTQEGFFFFLPKLH